ncbi:MAG: phosphonate degradation HD-domain oxygenase [Actinomycetota bacterium]
MSRTVVWHHLRAPAEIADAVIALILDKGQSRYDESVTQIEHALQCGAHAMAAGAADTVVVAAFLHDIGHLLLDEHDENGDFLDADLHHENVAARFLATWFGEAVTVPIELHVPAKRYLCAIEPDYAAGLSAASVRSLRVQGGAMTPTEIAAFERRPHHEVAIAIRRWDDDAKVAGAPVPDIEDFRRRIIHELARSGDAR